MTLPGRVQVKVTVSSGQATVGVDVSVAPMHTKIMIIYRVKVLVHEHLIIPKSLPAATANNCNCFYLHFRSIAESR